uniref:Traf2 and nck interacting kinase n=1 Tax=Triatoma infestans TaxID=30076 RepID=A0A161MGN3_TRIIF
MKRKKWQQLVNLLPSFKSPGDNNTKEKLPTKFRRVGL